MGMAGAETARGGGHTGMNAAGGGRLVNGLVRHLTPAQAAKLAAGRHRQALRAGRILLYRDHIPYVSFVVLEGTVGFELGRGTRLARSVTMAAPLVIGEHHVQQRKEFPMTVRALDHVVMCVGCPPGDQAASGAEARPKVARRSAAKS